MYFKRYRNCHVQKPLTSAEGSRGGARQRRLGMQLYAASCLYCPAHCSPTTQAAVFHLQEGLFTAQSADTLDVWRPGTHMTFEGLPAQTTNSQTSPKEFHFNYQSICEQMRNGTSTLTFVSAACFRCQSHPFQAAPCTTNELKLKNKNVLSGMSKTYMSDERVLSQLCF